MRSRVLLVGHRGKVEGLIRELELRAVAGFGVVGACLPEGEATCGEVAGVPVLGSMAEAARVAREVGADTVAVAGSDSLTADAVRRLGWDLEGSGIDLALAIALTDVAGPRVLMQPVSGLPLVYVDEPQFTGPKYVLKSVVDWVSALAITLLLSPVLLVIAALVKLTSRGPVLYRQERVGLNGRPFTLLKFRSMGEGADSRLADLAHLNQGNGPLFKVKGDPRVTRVGGVLRPHSLDELPQLLNVLRGDMSLVGPRPPLPTEANSYEAHVRRRLYVKPGLTGLWQVSGRSNLNWEESVRLDLYYVENWSLTGDFMILARTARVVFTGDGAY